VPYSRVLERDNGSIRIWLWIDRNSRGAVVSESCDIWTVVTVALLDNRRRRTLRSDHFCTLKFIHFARRNDAYIRTLD